MDNLFMSEAESFRVLSALPRLLFPVAADFGKTLKVCKLVQIGLVLR